MAEYCQLQLTCANKAEADGIAKTLLKKRLAACAKQISISSDFRWQGKIEHAGETLLVMDTKMNNFEKIEAEVKKLHSYNTFVLQATPIERISQQAMDWLEEEIK